MSKQNSIKPDMIITDEEDRKDKNKFITNNLESTSLEPKRELARIHNNVEALPNGYKYALKDALYNTRSDSGASIDYAHGIIIGLIAALMYKGYSYNECMGILFINLPNEKCRLETLPEVLRTMVENMQNAKNGG